MNIKKVNKIVAEKNIDAIYLTDMKNIRYVTGFTGTTGYALITKDSGIFFTDFRYLEQAAKEVKNNGFEIIDMGKKYFETLKAVLESRNIKSVGIEDNNLILSEYRKLVKEYDNINFCEIGDAVTSLRQIKQENEIERIKKAADIADKAFSMIIKEIKAGISEKELGAKLEYYMKKEGAEGIAFDTIIASGYRSAMPHGVASDKKIMEDEFIKFDFGCVYDGYVSDITRTIYFGEKISKKHLDIYDTVYNAQIMGIGLVRAGAKAAQVDATVREYIASRGYGQNFGHGLGHSIGLEVHESPSLSPRAGETVLEENMVLTVEPGVYIEGFGGVRIEDDVIVKRDGCEIINKTSKELLIIKNKNS